MLRARLIAVAVTRNPAGIGSGRARAAVAAEGESGATGIEIGFLWSHETKIDVPGSAAVRYD